MQELWRSTGPLFEQTSFTICVFSICRTSKARVPGLVINPQKNGRYFRAQVTIGDFGWKMVSQYAEHDSVIRRGSTWFTLVFLRTRFSTEWADSSMPRNIATRVSSLGNGTWIWIDLKKSLWMEDKKKSFPVFLRYIPRLLTRFEKDAAFLPVPFTDQGSLGRGGNCNGEDSHGMPFETRMVSHSCIAFLLVYVYDTSWHFPNFLVQLTSLTTSHFWWSRNVNFQAMNLQRPSWRQQRVLCCVLMTWQDLGGPCSHRSLGCPVRSCMPVSRPMASPQRMQVGKVSAKLFGLPSGETNPWCGFRYVKEVSMLQLALTESYS